MRLWRFIVLISRAELVETHPTLKVQALEDMKVRQRHLIMDVMLIAHLPAVLRIRMFLCLPDPLWLRNLPSSSKNSKKNLNSYCFVTSLWRFIFEKLCKFTFNVERWANCQKKEFAHRSKRSLNFKKRAFWAVRSLSDEVFWQAGHKIS